MTFSASKGAYLWDSGGQRYFDGFSTLWTNLIGHGREDIIDAMSDQLRKLTFMHLFSGTYHEPAIKLSEELVSSSPFGHSHCFFGTSGSDATETAIKMARSYWHTQGRLEKNHIIGRYSEYHGTSMGALSLMGWDSYRTPYTPLVAHTHRISPPNCFRCPWNLNRDSCGIYCKSSFRDFFEQMDAERTVSAILVEPIITSDGLITPPPGYWEEIQSVCKEFDVLVITDEVSTGMGRSGKFYAGDHYGLKPDITYLAKSLTSGYAPLSAVLTSPEIFKTLNQNSTFFSHGTTFGGHPASCVAALKTIQILSHENLVNNAARFESVLMKALNENLGTLDVVGNIRGKGLLFEVELVADRSTAAVPRDETTLAMSIYREALAHGLYIRPLGRFICIAPPLIATEDELVDLASTLRKVILAVQEVKSLW